MLVKTVTAEQGKAAIGCFHCGGQHFRSARGMHGQHIHAQPRRCAHSRGDRVGDIVKLQIKEDREARAAAVPRPGNCPRRYRVPGRL